MIALLPYLLLRIRKSKFSADSPRYNAFVKNVWNDFAIQLLRGNAVPHLRH